MEMTTVPPAALVAVALLVTGVGVLAWLLLTRPRVDKALLANLRRGLGLDQADADDAATSPSWLDQLARRLTPPGRQRALERLWARAGRPEAWQVPRLVVAKLVLPVVAAGLTL